MRTRWFHSFFGLIFVIVISNQASAAQQPSAIKNTVVSSISCGKTKMIANTTMIIIPPNEVVWLKQTIFIQSSSTGRNLISYNIRPNIIEGIKQLPIRVVSWSCITGKDGKYMLLSYACGRTDLRGACNGEREWFRILDQNGNRMDQGYLPQDSRYGALYARLGIADAMQGSTSMKDVTQQ